MDGGFDQVGMRPGYAFILALALESVLVGSLLLYLAFRPPALPNEIIPISVEIMEDKLVAEPVPEPEKKPEFKPAVLPPPRLPKVKPMPQPPAEAVPQIVATPAPVTSAPPSAAPSEIPAAAPPAPPPPPAAAKADPDAEYRARVKAAVQAALVFPAAAAALDFKGRAHVEFKLRDRVSSQARILMSSGMGLTDRAALQSVEAAQYPAPPASLQGKEATYQVWVEFNH